MDIFVEALLFVEVMTQLVPARIRDLYARLLRFGERVQTAVLTDAIDISEVGEMK